MDSIDSHTHWPQQPKSFAFFWADCPRLGALTLSTPFSDLSPALLWSQGELHFAHLSVSFWLICQGNVFPAMTEEVIAFWCMSTKKMI